MQQQRSTLQLVVHLLGLVLAPVLTLVFAVRDQALDYSGGAGRRFDEFVEHADLLGSQALLFFAIQVALVPAALAFPWLVRGRGRSLVLIGTGLYVLSALGHAAFSGSQLMLGEMVRADETGAMREVFRSFDSSSEFVFVAAPGLIGLVFGSLLLGIGILRSVELPWWIGASIIGFLVAEFALSNVGDWGTLVAAAFWAVALWGTAAYVWRARATTD